MKINVIGLGYIGLPTSLILASNGAKVVGTDLNTELISTLNRNEVTFEEEGLFDLYQSAVDNHIIFDVKYHSADVYIVTVPTPYIKETKKLDPKYIISAVKEILIQCPDGAILVIESTVSPGTIERNVRPLINDQNKKIRLVHAPERILPGAMISELVNNPRTIGVDDDATGQIIYDLYKTFCKGDIVITDIATAEMSKVVENTFRDINIAFANELLQICNEANLDVHEVIRIANKHPRVNILSPGPGVGGHCISVDPWFLVGDYPELTNLILQARKVNDHMPQYVLNKVESIMKEKGITDFKRVGFYGISYKEDVDDVRESPTLQLLEMMNKYQSKARFFDPMLKKKVIENQVLKLDEFLDNLELMIVMVAHKQIKSLSLDDELTILDTKNVLSGNNVIKL